MPRVTINNHEMYYEIHGEGIPVLLQGGWGSFCHGSEHHLPRGLTDSYKVIIIDYRGLYDSDDDLSQESSIDMSNIAIFNSSSKKADRVGIKINEDGSKVRIFKSTGKEIK